MRPIVLLFLITIITLPESYAQTSQKAERKYNKAYKRFQKGKYEKALELLNEAVSLREQSKYFYLRGVTNSMLENEESAVEDLSQAILIDPQYYEAWFERGLSYFKMNNISRSLSDYNRAIEINPEFSQAYFNRGSVRFSIDDTDGACKDWMKAKELGIKMAEDLIITYCLEDNFN